MSSKSSSQKRKKAITTRAARKTTVNQASPPAAKRRRMVIDSIVPVKTISIDKRQFYHIQSHQAFLVDSNSAAADDSADDNECVSWYQHIHQMEINHQRYLNEGEKEMFNLWNAFVDGQKCFGLKHTRTICDRFITLHIRDILQKKLYRNFLLHLCVLNDNGFLEAKDYMELVQNVQSYMGIITWKAFKINMEARQRKSEQKKKRSKSPVSIEPETKRTRKLRSANSA